MSLDVKQACRALLSYQWVCCRIQKRQDTLDLIRECIPLNAFHLVGEHLGKDGNNPHYHFCYQGDEKEQTRLRNFLTRRGYVGNEDKSVSKKFAPEYYYHEDVEGFQFTLKSTNVTYEMVEYWRELARQLAMGRKPKSQPENNDYVWRVTAICRKRGNCSFKFICQQIWATAHKLGKYYPDARQTERYARYIQGQLMEPEDLYEEMYNDWFRFYRRKKNIREFQNNDGSDSQEEASDGEDDSEEEDPEELAIREAGTANVLKKILS